MRLKGVSKMQTVEQKKSPYTKLPNKRLGQKPVSKQFIDRGAVDFHQACDYVWRLPYGRTQGSELSSVLIQGRGTCSSKHGLLKILADELVLDVDLVLGIYQMCEANTPGVSPAFHDTEYDSVPEAHCYLRYESTRVDLTRYELEGQPISHFLLEKTIVPEDLSTKADFHQLYLQSRFGKDESLKIWVIRERCISMLSGVQSHATNL